MFSLFLFCLFRIFCFQTTYTLSAIISNRHLPLDQNGQQLVTGEASVLQHNNTYYFYFNNWGNCPGIDCCPTKGGCASCCFNTFPNYTKSCSNLQNGSDPYGLYHTVQSYSTVDFIKWNNLGVALPLASREPVAVPTLPSCVQCADLKFDLSTGSTSSSSNASLIGKQAPVL